MPSQSTHGLLRWLGDLLIPNGTPGDLLLGWRTSIWLGRAFALAALLAGLLVAFGVLR